MFKVQFRIKSDGDKVAAIKTMRLATGLGLKESKEVMDKVFDTYEGITVVMTDAQFGRFMVGTHIYHGGVYVADVKELLPSFVEDFSDLPENE